MATYATQQDFVDAFGFEEMVQLTNLQDSAAIVVDITKLAQNQEKAKALIDGLISQNPIVAALMPFASVPELLKAYELDITRYYLDAISARQDVRQRYEDAIAQLKLIGMGKMGLGLIGSPEAPQAGAPVLSVKSYAPDGIFTEESLSGY
jgi:phage gp36-like protein